MGPRDLAAELRQLVALHPDGDPLLREGLILAADGLEQADERLARLEEHVLPRDVDPGVGAA
jgi:hypothetical protein